MTSLLKAALAGSFVLAAAAPGFADCAGHSADAGTKKPIVTADTGTQPVAPDKKG